MTVLQERLDIEHKSNKDHQNNNKWSNGLPSNDEKVSSTWEICVGSSLKEYEVKYSKFNKSVHRVGKSRRIG